MQTRQRYFWAGFFTITLVTLFLMPPAVFLLTMLAEGSGPGEALFAVIDQYTERRQNPLANTVLGLIPVAPLVLILVIYRLRMGPAGSTAIAIGGGIGIAAILLWANMEYWPNFLPGRDYPGFPHGLEIVIGSLFFAPVAMLVGVVMGVLWFRAR